MKRILVAYATRTRSTIDIAETIARILMGAGARMDVESIKSLRDVNGYDAVVIGSAIRMGQWLPEAVEFVKNNQSSLKSIPTAYFLVSGLLREDTPAMRQKVLANLDPVRQILEPKTIGLFAGKMDYSKLSSTDRTIAKTVGAEGDGRNWEAIRSWAQGLQTILFQA